MQFFFFPLFYEAPLKLLASKSEGKKSKTELFKWLFFVTENIVSHHRLDIKSEQRKPLGSVQVLDPNTPRVHQLQTMKKMSSKIHTECLSFNLKSKVVQPIFL